MDLSKVQAQSYDVLPKGDYIAAVTKAETKASKTGGEYLQLEFTITSSPQTGRKVFDIFNTKNANPKAVEIAMGKLKTLALAAGIPEAALVNFTPAMLAGKPVKITTDIKTDSYGDKAVVKKYSSTTTTNAATKVAQAFNTQQEVIPF